VQHNNQQTTGANGWGDSDDDKGQLLPNAGGGNNDRVESTTASMTATMKDGRW